MTHQDVGIEILYDKIMDVLNCTVPFQIEISSGGIGSRSCSYRGENAGASRHCECVTKRFLSDVIIWSETE